MLSLAIAYQGLNPAHASMSKTKVPQKKFFLCSSDVGILFSNDVKDSAIGLKPIKSGHITGSHPNLLTLVGEHEWKIVAWTVRELQCASIRQLQGGLEVINHTPARLFLLEESLRAEQSDVSIRHTECLSANSPSSAEDVPDGPRDCSNSSNAKGVGNPFRLLGGRGDDWCHEVSCERGQAERSSSVKDNWSVALGISFTQIGNFLRPHSGDITVRPQVLH